MNSPKFIKTSQTIALALMMGVATFLAITLMQAQELFFSVDFDNDFMIMVAMLFCAAGMSMSKFMYKQQFTNISEQPLESKIAKYQTAVIISLALLEAPALFAVVQLMLTNNTFFIVLVGLMLLLMLISFPTFFKFEMDCMLTREEKDSLEEK